MGVASDVSRRTKSLRVVAAAFHTALRHPASMCIPSNLSRLPIPCQLEGRVSTAVAIGRAAHPVSARIATNSARSSGKGLFPILCACMCAALAMISCGRSGCRPRRRKACYERSHTHVRAEFNSWGAAVPTPGHGGASRGGLHERGLPRCIRRGEIGRAHV